MRRPIEPLTALLAALMLTGCATVRQTDPPLTANEQLLISTAVDRAAAKLKLDLPPGSRVFLDASNFDADEKNVVYPKYAIAAVRDQVLRQGFRLASDRKECDAIVEMRSGAQSINEKNMLIGIPSIAVPVPFAGAFSVPEIALFKYHRLNGVSKLALSASRPDGTLAYSTDFEYGQAEQKHWVFLLFFWYTSHDLGPAAEE